MPSAAVLAAMPTGSLTLVGLDGRREKDVTRPDPLPVEKLHSQLRSSCFR